MKKDSFNWLSWISEIQAIVQSGLTYTENAFDKERYLRLRAITAEITAHCSGNQAGDIEAIFSLETGYATPKIDVRSFILKDNKILLVRERADGLWTLPGGFADVNETPSTAVIRETKEEAGYVVSVLKLLALWDKFKHEHPPHWPHIFKCFFHCEILSGGAIENIETSEQDFFDINHLPALSTPRVTASQLTRLHDLVLHPQATQFD